MTCKTCPIRQGCKKLCPEAEAYVNQDYVSQKERTYPTLPSLVHGGDYGNIDLDNIVNPPHRVLVPEDSCETPVSRKHVHFVKFPYTWPEMTDVPRRLCVRCRAILKEPVRPNQVLCEPCSVIARREGGRKRIRAFRNRAKRAREGSQNARG